VDDGVVVCPLHGLGYDLRTGEAVGGSGPGVCTHAATTDDDGGIRVVPECG
jgi:nitrite reductase (NADH) small subunit